MSTFKITSCRGHALIVIAFTLLLSFTIVRIASDFKFEFYATQSLIFSPAVLANDSTRLRQEFLHTSFNLTSLKPVPTVCDNETCRSIYAQQLHRPNTFPIPKIRHILWRNQSISAYFAKQLNTWQVIHPDWTYVLWRDQDLEPFVARNFPHLLAEFKSLKQHIMRVDMIRYMLLLKVSVSRQSWQQEVNHFGGTYADLDYSLVRSLDEVRRFHAVVTREPEAHSLPNLGLAWPIMVLANPAFLMSAPGHWFFEFVLDQLKLQKDKSDVLNFAGPFGLSRILQQYSAQNPLTNSSMAAVYVPPSFSFYPYRNNSLESCSKEYFQLRKSNLQYSCRRIGEGKEPAVKRLQRVDNLTRLCADVTNLDPITDSSQPVYAVHDLEKSGPSWDSSGPKRPEYRTDLVDMATIVRNLKLGADYNK